PGAVERLGQPGVVRCDLFQQLPSSGQPLATGRRALEAQGHVAHQSIEEGTEPTGAVRARALERAAGAKALEEDLLHRVLELLAPCAPPPACGQVRSHHGTVAQREAL